MTETRARQAAHSGLAAGILATVRACWGAGASGSMGPILGPGDRVLIAPVAAGDYRVGDLVAVERHGAVVVHRVVRRAPAGCWTRGDAVTTLDPFVPNETILGRAVALDVAGGRIILLDRGPWRTLGAVLGRASRLGALSARLPRVWPRRLAWRASRTPFYAVALGVRRSGRRPRGVIA